MHSSPAGDNATTAPAADERICRREWLQVGWHALSPKIAPSRGATWTPIYNTWLLGPTRLHKPDGISIGLAGLTTVTDRQTTLLGL